MFGSPEVNYHQTYSVRDWLSILRTPYPTQDLQRKHRTEHLQTTRKEKNWKTEEMLAGAVVTLETERIKGSNP
jgi:thioesterase domain-containing protein